MADKGDVDPGAQTPTLFFELSFSEDELLRALAAQIPPGGSPAALTLEVLRDVGGYTATVELLSGGPFGGAFTLEEERWERAYTHLLPENLRDRFLPVNVQPSRVSGSCGWSDECARTDEHLHVGYVLRFEFAATVEQRARVWNWYDQPSLERSKWSDVERNCYGLTVLRDSTEPDPGIYLRLAPWKARETVSRLNWPPQDRAKVASIARELQARMADVEDAEWMNVGKLNIWLRCLEAHSGR